MPFFFSKACWLMPVLLTFEKWWQKPQESKASLSYVVSTQAAWVSWDPFLPNPNNSENSFFIFILFFLSPQHPIFLRGLPSECQLGLTLLIFYNQSHLGGMIIELFFFFSPRGSQCDFFSSALYLHSFWASDHFSFRITAGEGGRSCLGSPVSVRLQALISG